MNVAILAQIVCFLAAQDRRHHDILDLHELFTSGINALEGNHFGFLHLIASYQHRPSVILDFSVTYFPVSVVGNNDV